MEQMQQNINTTLSSWYASYLVELQKGGNLYQSLKMIFHKLQFQLNYELADVRVENWLWMDTPFKTVAILLVYLMLLRFITSYMTDKKPFDLKPALVAYNFIQVIGSFWCFYEFVTVAYLSGYSLKCQTVDYSTGTLPMRVMI